MRRSGAMIILREVKDRLKTKKFMQPVVYIWHFVHRLPAYIKGTCLILKLWHTKNSDEIYFVLGVAIGEIVYGMAYIGALMEKYRDKQIVVIGNGQYEALIRSYSIEHKNLQFRILAPIETYQIWRNFIILRGFANVARHLGIISAYIPGYYSLKDNSKINFLCHLRKEILMLPNNVGITYHNLRKGKITSIPDFEKIKHKIVILNPYSGSMSSNKKIYETICKYLMDKGYVVFTNTAFRGNTRESISGSIPLSCDIYELFSIACEIPLVVSVRSGITEFLLPSGVNLFVLYENCGENSIARSTLTAYKTENKIEELYVTKKTSAEIICERLSLFLNKLEA